MQRAGKNPMSNEMIPDTRWGCLPCLEENKKRETQEGRKEGRKEEGKEGRKEGREGGKEGGGGGEGRKHFKERTMGGTKEKYGRKEGTNKRRREQMREGRKMEGTKEPGKEVRK
jgi:hypothetical protein